MSHNHIVRVHASFRNTLEFLHDLSLTTKVNCLHKTSHLFYQYQEDTHKLEEHMWEAGQLKDASMQRLEGANTLHQIEEALVELNHRAAAQHVCMERGHSNWKGGDVMKWSLDTYYTVMTNVSK